MPHLERTSPASGRLEWLFGGEGVSDHRTLRPLQGRHSILSLQLALEACLVYADA
jgi:hypothetical protein